MAQYPLLRTDDANAILAAKSLIGSSYLCMKGDNILQAE